jgi:tetratricopeptide (TPR) repeat protein
MWFRVALLAVLLSVPVLAGEKELLEALHRARTAEERRAAVEAIDANIGEGLESFLLLSKAARRLAAVRALDDALALLDRHRLHIGEKYLSEIDGIRADLLAKAGRLDEAVEAAKLALSGIPDIANSGDWGPRERLARLYEKKGDWAAAAEQWRAAVERSGCGTCAMGREARRAVAILRCRYWQGEEEAALEGLWKALTSPDGGCREGWRDYLELSARAGRLEVARRRLEDLPERTREWLARPLAIATGFAENKPAILVKGLDGRTRPDEWEFGLRLITEMGTPAIDEIGKMILAGDDNAIRVARRMRAKAVLPALRSRLSVEKDRRRKSELRAAIQVLDR